MDNDELMVDETATVTMGQVRAAFQTLEDHMARQGADAAAMWALRWAGADVLSILGGTWMADDDPRPTDADGPVMLFEEVVL